MENGDYPADAGPATVPSGIEKYFKTSTTPATGNCDWGEGVLGVAASFSVMGITARTGVFAEIYKTLDDGSASTGVIQ
ncbi:MAG: hypothetical protein CMI18_12600 [Opitutaceae bacterium]|nr:hypothetical protein [Opitutaceae bacterium]